MLNCRQVTRLVSQSMDAKLSWPSRLGIRLHLLYCVWCRRYAHQLQLLRKATSNLSAESFSESAQLSTEAKAEMRSRLQEALKQPPSRPA
jgi:hypothetical protein